MSTNIAAPGLCADRNIKWSYATHVLPEALTAAASVPGRLGPPVGSTPAANDVLVAEVLEIGHHRNIELNSKRRATLFPGDLLGLSYGHRYATKQFEGRIPATTNLCQMLSIAGVCGEVLGAPDDIFPPTSLRPLGYLLDTDRRRVNLRDHGLRAVPAATDEAKTVLVVGSSMDAGKSTVAASLINGLVLSGAVVCAAKLTGTACMKDAALMEDAGASKVLDFTDVGHASTAMCTPSELWNIVDAIRSCFSSLSPDYVVYEIADGLVQPETVALIQMFHEHHSINATIYACAGTMSVAAGVERLRCLDLNLVALSGLVTFTPLSTREAQTETGMPVLRLDELRDPDVASRLIQTNQKRSESSVPDSGARKEAPPVSRLPGDL